MKKKSEHTVPAPRPEAVAPQEFHASFFEQLLASLEDPLFVKNDQHQWIYTNQAFQELVGTRDLVGKTDSDFLPADQVEMFYEGDRYVIAEQKSLTQEENIGEDCYALVKKMPITLPDGEKRPVRYNFRHY